MGVTLIKSWAVLGKEIDMRVKCTNNPTGDSHLVIGKEYVVRQEKGNDYILKYGDGVITFPHSCFEWVSDRVTLSKMDCYAGKLLVEAVAHDPNIFDEAGIYVQFIEGCGYSPYTMTPDEADALADRIKEAAAETRRMFRCAHKNQSVNDRSQFVCDNCDEELGR